MRTETVRPLDTETLDLFASKGKEGGPGIPQAGIANGVVQIVRDLAKRPMEDLCVLDLACGEGVYAIETALRSVIYLLGILYHLDVPEVFHVVENIYDICRELVIIDTHVCLLPQSDVQYKGRAYKRAKTREHGDNDPDSVRRSKLLKSLDNTFSFQFTRDEGVSFVVRGERRLNSFYATCFFNEC
jgi:hypothetical protein